METLNDFLKFISVIMGGGCLIAIFVLAFTFLTEYFKYKTNELEVRKEEWKFYRDSLEIERRKKIIKEKL